MKKAILTLAIILKLSAIYAQDAVHDFASYGQLLEQTARLTEQVENAKKTVEKMEFVNEGIAAMRTNLSTFYNNTFGIIGQVDGLIESVKGIPASFEKGAKQASKYVNCLGDDLEFYQQAENLRTAKYYTRTPKGHTYDYGVNEQTKIKKENEKDDKNKISDGFGSNNLQQFRDRPCGMVITYQLEAENKKIAFAGVDNAVTKYTKNYQTAEKRKEIKKDLEELQKKIKNPKLSIADLQSQTNDILFRIYKQLNEMHELMFVFLKYELEYMAPEQPDYQISDENLENLNNLSDEELYLPTNTLNMLDQIIGNYDDSDLTGGLPF